MRTMVTRAGYVKFWRLGPLEFADQSRWGRAPRSRGMWAFPYPFYDPFFTYHKYTDLVPKRLQGDEVSYEDREEWVNKVGRKILPIREFWYQGDVFTHFMPNGEIGDTGLFNPEDTDWTLMDVSRFSRNIVSTGSDKALYRFGDTLELIRSSIDHLEVFIAPNMGRLREGAPSKR